MTNVVPSRRPLPLYDEDLLNDDPETSAHIVDRFRLKTRKFKRIFCNSPESAEKNLAESFGIRLISQTEDAEPNEKDHTSKSRTVHSLSRQPLNTQRRTEKLHMRVLSPIELISSSEEDLTESPRKSRLAQSSLLEAIDRQQVTNVLSTSTPLTKRKAQKSNFFNTTNGRVLSPINQSQEESRRSTNVPVTTLAQFESDLQNRYDITNKSVHNGTNKKPAELTSRNKKTKNCTVMLDQMDIDDQSVSKLLLNFSRVSKTVNKTNLNSMKIVETPLARRPIGLTPVCDSELASKLKLCETSSDNRQISTAEQSRSLPTTPRASRISKTSNESNKNKSAASSNAQTSDLSEESTSKNKSKSAVSRNITLDEDNRNASPVSRTANKTQSVVRSKSRESKQSQTSARGERVETDNMSIYKTVSDCANDSLTSKSTYKTATSELQSPKRLRRRTANKTQSVVRSKSQESKQSKTSARGEPVETDNVSIYKTVSDCDNDSLTSKSTYKSAASKIQKPKQLPRKSNWLPKSFSLNKSLENAGSEKGQVETVSVARNHDDSTVPDTPQTKNLKSRASKQSKNKLSEASIDDNEDQRSNASLNEPSELNKSNSSLSKVMSARVLNSISNLLNKQSVADPKQIDSLKIAAPTRKRKVSNVNSTAQNFLQLSKRSKKYTEENSLKRTLFSQEEDSQPQNHVTNSSKSLDFGHTSTDDEKSAPNEAASELNLEHTETVTQKKKRVLKPRKQSPETDEGFNSDLESSRTNALYKPEDRGCKREGLRERRLATPWWVHSGTRNMIGFTYGTLTNDTKERKYYREIKAAGLKERHFLSNSELYLNVDDKLKIFNLKKDILAKKKYVSNGTKQPGSLHSASSFNSYMNMIKRITGSNGSQNHVETNQSESYDIASAQNMDFQDCGNGLYYAPFLEGKSDGMIKLIPGGYKKKALSRGSFLKYFVLQGTIVATVHGQTITVPFFSYLHINSGYHYELKNTSDKDAILQFYRFKIP